MEYGGIIQVVLFLVVGRIGDTAWWCRGLPTNKLWPWVQSLVQKRKKSLQLPCSQ